MTASQNPTTPRFLALQCYDQLEQALIPIREAIQNLEQDWKPRPPEFWERLETCLAQIQQAVNACIAVASTASIAHRSCLYYVIGCVDEVGTRLAAYQEKSSSAQKQQQRQVVLHALRKLHKEGQETLTEGRAWLDRVRQDQYPSSVLASKRTAPTASKTTPASRRGTSTSNRTNPRPMLRLVGNQATEEDSSDAPCSG